MADIGSLEISLKLRDEMSKGIDQITNGIGDVTDKGKKATKEIDAMEKSLTSLIGDYDKLYAAAQKAPKGFDTKGIEDSAKKVKNVIDQLSSQKPEWFKNDGNLRSYLDNISKLRQEVQETAKATDKFQDTTRNVRELASKLESVVRAAEKMKGNGLNLNVSTQGITKAIADMNTFISKLKSADASTMGVGGRASFADWKQEANEMTRSLKEATAAQKDLNNAQVKANKKDEAEKKRAEADAMKLLAQMAREDAKAEQQRQREVEISTKRIQSLARVIRDMKSAKFTGEMLGLDTTSITRHISDANAKLRELYEIRRKLTNGDLSALGMMGSTGNGREVSWMRTRLGDQSKADAQAIRNEAQLSKEAARANQEMERSTRNINELQGKLGVLQRSAEKLSSNGTALGVSTTGIDKAIGDVKALVSILSSVDVSKLGVGKNLSMADLVAEYNSVVRSLREAASAQRELNNAQKRSNDKETAKNTRDAANAEKQRQREIEQSLNRIQSLRVALRGLWSTRQQSVSLGVDTSKIDASIQEVIEKIRWIRHTLYNLQAGNATYIGALGNMGNGRYVATLREARDAQQKLNAATIANNQAQAELVSHFQQVSSAATHTNGVLSQMRGYLQTFIGFDGIRNIIGSIVTVGGQMEMQHIGLQTIIGDLQDANEIWGQIKGLALQSPFTFSELSKDVKQLAAYGIETNELYDTTKRLADVASGVSVSFERIALAYGQTMARAKLDGKELRQFANAGIPILSELAKYYKETRGVNLTEGQVRQMTFNGEVSFEDVKAVFKSMTDEGGRFYNMQLVQSETLLGRYNKLKDAWEIMLSEFASKDSIVGSFFSSILDGATAVVQNLKTLLPVIMGLLIPRAFKNVGGGATGRQIGANILSSKQGLASTYQQKVLSGKSLSPVEAGILKNKEKINILDVKALYNAKALTNQDIQRLIVAKQITKEEAKQLIGAQANWAGWKLFLSGAWSGVKSMGSGILNFFGGLPGIAIGAGMAIFTYWMNKYQDIKNQTKQMQDEFRQRQQNISGNNKTVSSRISTAKANNDISSMIESYEELLKQAEEISPIVLAKKMANDHSKSFAASLEYLQKVNVQLDAALVKSQEIANLFPEAAEDANGWFTEDIKSNVADLEKAIAKYRKAKSNGLVNDLPSLNRDIFDNEDILLKQFSEMAKQVKEELGKEWDNDTVKNAAIMNLESWLSSQEMNDETKFIAKVQFAIDWNDMSLLWPTVKEKLKAQIESDSSDLGKSIKEKLLSGGELSDEESKYAQNLVKNIVKSLADKTTSDGIKKQIMKLLNGNTPVKIVAQLAGTNGKPWKAYYYEEIKKVSSDTSNKLKIMIDQAGTISDMWDAVQKAYDNAKSKIKKLKGIKIAGLISFEGKRINYKDAYKKAGLWDVFLSGKGTKEQMARLQQITTAIKEVNDMVEIFNSTQDFAKQEGYDIESNSSKKDKKNSGTKKDPIAEEWKNRLSWMQEYRNEYNKWLQSLGQEKALAKMSEMDKEWNGKLPSGFDRANPEQSMRDYYDKNVKGKAKTDAQKSADTSWMKMFFGWDEEDAKKDISKAVSVMQKNLSDVKSKWALYDKAKKSTSNTDLAAQIAFGGSTPYENSLQDYTDRLKTYMSENGIDIDINELLGMSDEEIVDKYKDSIGKPLVELVKTVNEATKELANSTTENYLRILNDSKTYADKIKDIQDKLKADLGVLDKKGGTEEQKQGLRSKAQKDTATLLFKQFQEDSGWEKLFDDLSRVSNDTLDTFEEKIKEFATTAGLGVTETKALVNAIKKVREEQISRNPLKYIAEGFIGTNPIRGFMQSATPNADGTYTVDRQTAATMGISKTGNLTKAELNSMANDWDEETSSNFISGLNAASKALEAFEGVLKPVADLFEAMGNDTMSSALNIGSTAMSTASTTASSFSSLSNVASKAGLGDGVSKALGKAGAFGAAASAALSITTSLFNLHDKSIQKEIDASKQRQKEAETLYSNLQSALEKSFGGLYSSGQSGTYEEMRSALETKRNEAANQLALEQSKKKKDDDTIADMKQELYEAEQAVKEYTETMAESLYGIDFKSYASSFADALVDAWAQGKSAAEAYGDAVNDILKEVATSVIKQEWIEQYIEPLAQEFYKKFNDNNGIIDDSMMALLSQMYDYSEGLGDVVGEYMTQMEYIANQHGETLKETSTGTLANGIESITEDTADLLAGYINSIRADTSIIRSTNIDILKSVQSMSGMPTIARSQLEQLNVIAANTARSAESAEMIYNVLNKVTNGTLHFSIK